MAPATRLSISLRRATKSMGSDCACGNPCSRSAEITSGGHHRPLPRSEPSASVAAKASTTRVQAGNNCSPGTASVTSAAKSGQRKPSTPKSTIAVAPSNSHSIGGNSTTVKPNASDSTAVRIAQRKRGNFRQVGNYGADCAARRLPSVGCGSYGKVMPACAGPTQTLQRSSRINIASKQLRKSKRRRPRLRAWISLPDDCQRLD
jgi:hypothetical protein